MDQLTGYGVQPLRPVITFAVGLVAFLFLRALIVYWDNRPLGLLVSAREAIAVPSKKGEDVAYSKACIWHLRLIHALFGLLAYVQVTACSIYFSQTTLQ